MKSVFREVRPQIMFRPRTSVDFPAHIHEDIELIYVKKGRCAAFCDGRKYILEDNTFFLVFPNQAHHYAESVRGEYFLLVLKPSRLLSYSEVFLEGVPTCAVCQPKENDNTVFLLTSAYQEFQQDGDSKIISGYLTILLGKLLKYYTIESSGVRQDTILQILDYCAGHYRENISVADIAAHLHISRSSVSHIFNSRLGIHFCDYINALRLTDSVDLLKNGSYSMTEIADMTGFPSIRTFNRAFAKQYGMAPSLYKKQLHPKAAK